MTAPISVLGFPCSLRRESWNKRLLGVLARRAPADLLVVDAFDLADVPLYNGDLDVDGGPPAVRAMKEAAAAADALLFVTPEYNWGAPAVAKNVLDWLSRPMPDGPVWNAPMAVAGTSPGRGGATQGMAQLVAMLGIVSPNVFPEALSVPSARHVMDEDGELIDDETAVRIDTWLADAGSFLTAKAAELADGA